MGSVVLRVIDRLDGLLGKINAHSLHLQQHIGLILEALPFYPTETLQVLAGNGPQAGLCVGKFNAVAEAKQAGSSLVPGHASGWDARLVKISAAQDHLIAQGKHFLPAGDDIRQQVLAIAVNGNDAFYCGQILQHIVKGGFQSRALAPVHRVRQYMALLMGGSRFKKCFVPGTAAIVYNDDMFKAACQQPLHHSGKFFIRIKGGQNNGKVFLALFFCNHKDTFRKQRGVETKPAPLSLLFISRVQGKWRGYRPQSP